MIVTKIVGRTIKVFKLQCIQMDNEIKRELEDVRHIPELKRNMISLGTLDKKGCGYKCDRGSLEIYKGEI